MNETGETKALVPNLRFPEFCSSAPWETAKLGKLVKTVSPPRKLQTHEYLISGQFPIVDQSQSQIAGWTNDMSAILPVSSILIVFGDHTCALKRITVPFAQGADGIKILKPLQEIDADFLFQSLSHRPLQMEEYKRHFGILCDRIVAMPNISLVELRSQSVAEQRKIAECLQSLDELIAAETEKLEALKRHKKGLLQQLFPVEGETTPRLRFSQFSNAGNWTVSALGDVCEISSGGTPLRSRKDYWNGSIPWVTTSLIDGNRITIAEEFITELAVSETSAKLFPPDTIVIAMYGQGKTRGKVAFLGIPATTNQACAAILPNHVVDSQFLFFQLFNAYDRLRSLSNSGGQDNLSQALINQFEVVLPPNNEEQLAIISALDDISLICLDQEAQVANLRLHKAALMQQLFPSLDELDAPTA